MPIGFPPELSDTNDIQSFEQIASRYYEVDPREPADVEIAARTHPGKVRPNNEDNYLVVRRRRQRELLLSSLPSELFPAPDEQSAYTLAVADGMGGQQFGEIASFLALRTGWELGNGEIKWTLKVNPREAEEMKQKARVCFQLIHRRLRSEARAYPRLQGMGTTLTICYTTGPELFVMHAGDSRAYLERADSLERLTRDHSLAQNLIDAGQIEPGSPEEKRVRHVLTNSLGAHYETVDVDFEHYRLMDGDRVLLCTDGLTDLVSDAELFQILRDHPACEAACQALLEIALERGGRDNITIVLARYRFDAEAMEPSRLPGLSS